MIVGDALQYARKTLASVIGEFSLPQSEEILEFLLHCSRQELYSAYKRELSAIQEQQLSAILNRRISGEPLPYILGRTYFYDREFVVTPDVLIPRPDSETLVEKVLSTEKNCTSLFADIGVGSGIIACILTEHNPGWRGIGIDISIGALKIARVNSKSSVSFLCADLLSSCKNSSHFDFIVSNPPYIAGDEMNILDPDVHDFEPHSALYGGIDGLSFYRKLAADAKRVLKEGGRIFCEIGYNQAESTATIFSEHGWTEISITNDLGKNPRVLLAVAPQEVN